MADVFISYKSEDRAAVEDIVNGLTAENVSVWWDQGIAPTTEWRAEIHRQLQAAKVVVVVWSRASTDFTSGKWVIQEAEEADKRGALVPVLIDDVAPPLGLRHVQAGDLIDWRGDRRDPRWGGFMETVRAKLEGRAVDAAVARDTGPRTLGAMTRGRVGLLTLALGLAALVIGTTLAFGPLVAAAVAGGFALAYFVLNLLFARRRGERAAASFLRRAFAVGWVTIAANVLVWTAAAGAFVYPYARERLYDDFSIAVVDELRRPVADAQITVVLGERRTRVALNSDGVGVFEYPLYWGAPGGEVAIQHRDYSASHAIQRGDDKRFADMTIGAPSGVERFRVSHLTLAELAIDLMHKGRVPVELTSAFPNIVGVVQNPVWDTTEAYLSMFWGILGSDIVESGSYAGAVEFSAPGEVTARQDIEGAARDRYQGLRFPETRNYEFAADFSNGVEGCPVNRPLDGDYRLALNTADDFNFGDFLTGPDPGALERLGAARDEGGRFSGEIVRLIDHQWLQRNRQTMIDFQTREFSAEYARRSSAFVDFFIERRLPFGVAFAEASLAPRPGCGSPQTMMFRFWIRTPKLRISIIENVSDEALPIGAIVQRLTDRQGARPWSAEDRGEARLETPWAGGTLAPGAAIVVPRRLFFDDALSPDELTAYRAQAQNGETVSFTVAPFEQRFPDAEPYEREGIRFQDQGSAFTIRAGQMAMRERINTDMKGTAVYPLGASVDSLAVALNGVEFALREDEGRNLAMLAGSVMVGSCPFVFAAHEGSTVMLNRGQIIRDQIGRGAEGADRVYLGRTVSAVEIRELEPEVTRLNRVRLIVEKADGREVAYAASGAALRARDGRYIVLRQGERTALRFPGYTPAEDDVAVYLEAVGYYTTVLALLRDYPAIAR